MSGANVGRVERDGTAAVTPQIPVIIPAFALSALVATALSWGALGYALKSLESVWQDRVEALAELHETSAPFYRVLPQLSELGHPVAMDSAAIALTNARVESVAAWKLYLATTLTEAEIALVNQTTGPVAQLHKGAADLAATLRSGNHENYVTQVDREFLPRLSAVAQRMEGLVALQQTVTRERVKQARERHQWARGLLIGSGALAAVVVIASLKSRLRARR